MYVLFSMRKQILRNRINNLNMRLMQLSQQQIDLATYGANIADGIITTDEVANSPASILQKQYNYTTNTLGNDQGTGQSVAMADEYMSQYEITNGATLEDESRSSLWNSFQQTALKELAQQENKRISIQDQVIEQEMQKIQTQLTAANAELESVQKEEENAIKSCAPKYGSAPA